MNDAPTHLTSRALLDDPDAVIRAGDVLAMLDSDYELARAIAQHHGLLGDSEPRERNPIETARWIAWILCQGEREMVRRRDGEEALRNFKSEIHPKDDADAAKIPLRDRLLKFIEQADELKAREARGRIEDED